jgi:hypothetical protein
MPLPVLCLPPLPHALFQLQRTGCASWPIDVAASRYNVIDAHEVQVLQYGYWPKHRPCVHKKAEGIGMLVHYMDVDNLVRMRQLAGN